MKPLSRERLLSQRVKIAHLYECQWLQGHNDDRQPIVSLIDKATQKEVYIGTEIQVADTGIEAWVKRCQSVSGLQRPVFGGSA